MRRMASNLHVVTGPLCIEQGEIESVIGFQNQVRTLNRIIDQQSAAILGRLLAGSKVEPGTHTAEIEQVGGVIHLAIH